MEISKGIVITTSDHTKQWLPQLLESIKGTNYPVTIHNNGSEGGWEMAGVQKGKDIYDEFVHLMDTTVIKDISLFDKLFAIDGNVFLTEGGYHYMGKFLSNELPNLPVVSNKQEAINQELKWFKGMKYSLFSPNLPVHTDVFETKHDQRRMKMENDYMIKWKGTYQI